MSQRTRSHHAPGPLAGAALLFALGLPGCAPEEDGEAQGVGSVDEDSLSAADLNQLGVDAHDQGLYQDALARFDQAITKNPWVPQVHKNRGTALYMLNLKADAVEAYRKGLELSGEDAELHNFLIDTLGELGRFEEAVEACLTSMELVPDNEPAYNRRGQAHFAMGQHEEALQAFDDANARLPDDETVLVNRCQTLIELGFLDQALLDVKRLEELASPHAAGLQRTITQKAVDQ